MRFPRQEVGCDFLLQEIFPTQGVSPCLLHWQADSLPLGHQGSPNIYYILFIYGVAIMVNWRVQNAVLGCNLKNDRMISVRFQGKLFNITIIQVYATTSNAEEAEVEWFYEDLQDLLELTPKKRCPFHYRGRECKSRKSRNTWSNRQIWPWNTKWNRAKTNRVLPRKCTGHNKHPLPTTQEKTLYMDITRWSTLKSDWLYSF